MGKKIGSVQFRHDGRFYIPRAIQEALGLKIREFYEVIDNEDGTFTFKPKSKK